MTDLVNEKNLANLSPLLAFMLTEHTDPVDQLVARAISLRWNAYAAHHSLVKNTTLSAATLHTAIFADVVLAEVQKQRHYDVLVNIVEGLQVEYGFLLDETLGMNSSASVIEHIARYDAILDDCEKILNNEEVSAAMTKSDNAFYNADHLCGGDDIVRHELRHDYRTGAALHEPFGADDTALDFVLIAAYNSEAYRNLLDGDAPLLGRFRTLPLRSISAFHERDFAFGAMENASPLSHELWDLSHELAHRPSIDRAKLFELIPGVDSRRRLYAPSEILEALVSEHVKLNPRLKINDLFWKLVEQCADTIAFATEAGKTLDFVTSHSGFGSARNSVTLMIEDVPVGIRINDSSDGRFEVVRRGIKDNSIKTDADLLALVKKSLG
jgi:hypothetical protein